jgi:hypothetical protein
MQMHGASWEDRVAVVSWECYTTRSRVVSRRRTTHMKNPRHRLQYGRRPPVETRAGRGHLNHSLIVLSSLDVTERTIVRPRLVAARHHLHQSPITLVLDWAALEVEEIPKNGGRSWLEVR